MSLSKAIQFVKEASIDKELRKVCNQSDSKEYLLTTLGFDSNEFDDAINMRLIKCQTYEEANQVQQLKLWFTLL